jgi:hypothetical protein
MHPAALDQKFTLEFGGGMVWFLRASELHQALPLGDRQAGHDDGSGDYRNDYAHYQRFGRREKRLAGQQKFPTHRQKRTWRWVFSFKATPETLSRNLTRSSGDEVAIKRKKRR